MIHTIRNLATLVLTLAAICPAQTLPPVPTTKILAIGRLANPLTPEQRRTIMPKEVPDTVTLPLVNLS